eukprot:2559457-Pleurochrysis_carterae.AAC.7
MQRAEEHMSRPRANLQACVVKIYRPTSACPHLSNGARCVHDGVQTVLVPAALAAGATLPVVHTNYLERHRAAVDRASARQGLVDAQPAKTKRRPCLQNKRGIDQQNTRAAHLQLHERIVMD